jgi:hypothetical protein
MKRANPESLLALTVAAGKLVGHKVERRAPDVAYVLVLANDGPGGKMCFSTNVSNEHARAVVGLLRELANNLESDLDHEAHVRNSGMFS